MKSKIIDGYNGIMPLDLTNVDPKYHKEMIRVHLNDIKIYKKEQSELPEKLRYENNFKRIQEQLNHEKHLENIRKKREEKEKEDYFNKYYLK